MPRRETRQSIERALAEHRRKRCMLPPDIERRVQDGVERKMAEARKVLARDNSAEIPVRVARGSHKLVVSKRRRNRRRGDGSMPALVGPPRGPKPLSGGAAAPLEFD